MVKILNEKVLLRETINVVNHKCILLQETQLDEIKILTKNILRRENLWSFLETKYVNIITTKDDLENQFVKIKTIHAEIKTLDVKIKNRNTKIINRNDEIENLKDEI